MNALLVDALALAPLSAQIKQHKQPANITENCLYSLLVDVLVLAPLLRPPLRLGQRLLPLHLLLQLC